MSIEAMSLVEAAKQALEALELVVTLEWHPAFTRKEYDSDEPEENELRERVLTAITALRTAIEEAEKREWVHATQWRGLTDEEIEECWDGYLSDYQLQMIREMEAKLKEKNT